MNLQNFKNKVNECTKPVLLVTVVKLPSGALETTINNSNIESKIEYIINAYDENLKLKTCNEIQIKDFIIL